MRFVLLGLLLACGGSPPPVANTKTRAPAATAVVPPALEPDLALFRASRGKPWRPEQEPAVEACRRIFDGMTFVGQSEDDVKAELGPPDTVAGTRWDYMRHNGEVGCSRTITVDDGRVVAVRVNMTQ